MEAQRIKAARRGLWRIWVFAGLLWSVFFLLLACGIAWALAPGQLKLVQLALMLGLFVEFGVLGIARLIGAFRFKSD